MLKRFLLLLWIALVLPGLADPVSLTDIVDRKDYQSAGKLAARLAEALGRDLKTDLPPTSSVEINEKVSGRLIVTDKPLQVTNLQGCVVLSTEKVVCGAYVSDSLIISSKSVSIGSYLADSVVFSGKEVGIGSYSEGNVVQAAKVAVGSYSSGSTYYNVKPFVGKPGSKDVVRDSDVFTRLIEF